MGRAFADEAGVTQHTGWDDGAATELLAGLIESPDGILLCSNDGMIGGLVFGHPFSGQRVFQEMFWRSHGRDGMRLLRAAEAKARGLGAVRSFMIGMDSLPDLDRLYSRLGYAPAERTYSKGL